MSRLKDTGLTAGERIAQLQLAPHPEGGRYRETYRATELVNTPRGPRAASTAILFLLAAGERSCWHRIASDELWHHHGGGGLVIHERCQAERHVPHAWGLSSPRDRGPSRSLRRAAGLQPSPRLAAPGAW